MLRWHMCLIAAAHSLLLALVKFVIFPAIFLLPSFLFAAAHLAPICYDWAAIPSFYVFSLGSRRTFGRCIASRELLRGLFCFFLWGRFLLFEYQENILYSLNSSSLILANSGIKYVTGIISLGGRRNSVLE